MKIQKLIIIILTVTVVIVAGSITAYGAFTANLSKASKQDFAHNQKVFTSTAANGIERYFYDIQKRLETIALMPNVRDAVRSEACNQGLQDILKVNSREFSNLGRIDGNGTFVCAVNRAVVGEPASKYGNYFETIAKDPAHKPVMSRLIYPTGSDSPVVAVHVPVYDSRGVFSGTIGGAVYFKELQERILPDAKISGNSVMALYDNNLDILYHPDPLIRGKNLLAPDILQLYAPRSVINFFADEVRRPPAEGVIQYSLRGKERQTIYKSVHVIGRYWTIGVAVPHEDIQKAVGRQPARHIFTATLLLLVLIIIAGTILWGRKAIKKSHKHQ